jgi:hypothetical protein
MSRFSNILIYASASLLVLYQPSTMAANGPQSSGVSISSYSVGQTPFGESHVYVFPELGKSFADPAGCAGTESPIAILKNTGDADFRLLLLQIMSSVATGQNVTLFLGSGCQEIAYGAQSPTIIGLRVHAN